ncbi:MAG: sel1 repeat family protein [Rhodospirillales bacterium]|nr:sel1 repeat family protein [Rhodospirillales bacterium]
MIRNTALAALVVTLLLGVGAAALDIPEATWEFHRAQTAIQEGNYQKALPTIREFAEMGNASAQWILGDFHKNGNGVPKDLELAAMWYHRAIAEVPAAIPADPPEPSAMHKDDWALAVRHLQRLRAMCPAVTATLGAFYYRGQGVSKDLVEAYKWFQLAEGYGHPKAAIVGKAIEAELTGAQIAEAKGRLRDWIADHRRFETGIVERYMP